jgi:hypothetical protein
MVFLNLLVHPCDDRGNPGAGGLWRWAVHDGTVWTDPTSCLQAAAELDRESALITGQRVVVACARVAEMCGQLEIGDTYELDHDPIGEPWPILEIGDY